jgi:hypothetical protein
MTRCGCVARTRWVIAANTSTCSPTPCGQSVALHAGSSGDGGQLAVQDGPKCPSNLEWQGAGRVDGEFSSHLFFRPRPCSSVGQSGCLLSSGSQVRVLPGARCDVARHRRQMSRDIVDIGRGWAHSLGWQSVVGSIRSRGGASAMAATRGAKATVCARMTLVFAVPALDQELGIAGRPIR